MQEKETIIVLSIGWALASLGGIAAMLRTGKDVSFRLVVMALTNSGLCGLASAAWLYDKLELTELIAVSIMVGLGGMEVVNLAIQSCKKLIQK